MIQEVIDEFIDKRKQAGRPKLRWRVSRAVRRSLGWIPFTNQIASGAGKASLDVGWSTLRNVLEYKCDHAGGASAEVNEAYTTQTCSGCGARSGPPGRDGLAIRRWVCGDCGAVHDRDQNAALNIARLGCETLGLKGSGNLGL